jgi:hypothetical protein
MVVYVAGYPAITGLLGTVPPYLWILPEYVTLGVNFPQRFVCRRFAVLCDVLPYFGQVALCGGCAGKLRHDLPQP